MQQLLLVKCLQIVPETRVRLRDTTRILDHDPRHPQPDQRHAHRHAVVVVCFDLGPVQRSRRDRQPIGEFIDFCADSAQFGRQRGDAVGFLVADVRDVADSRRPLREARDGGWSVRQTERRARETEEREDRPTRSARGGPVVIHPDLADALGAAEDALSAALGREVSVRPKGDSYRVEFELDDPREGVDMAERVLRRSAA